VLHVLAARSLPEARQIYCTFLANILRRSANQNFKDARFEFPVIASNIKERKSSTI